jgi:hypothetical protein
MKTFVVLTVSIVLVSILFCPMVMAGPTMPADLQMVQPDPSLPKELEAFWGKWEGTGGLQFFIIVEKIDEEKASLYVWRGGTWAGAEGTPLGWSRYEAIVIKKYGKYNLWYYSPFGITEYTLEGKYLDTSSPGGSLRLSRVP